MLSYARNAEDVVLARAFGAQPSGFYIDVGAGDPESGSVTRHFYEREWSGINVEPSPRGHALLRAARPRDLNLPVTLAGHPPADREDPAGGDVEVTTLAELCARHVTGAVDFLRIDASGAEDAVIQGGDWTRFRPRVVLVLTARAGPVDPSPAPGEARLLAANYRFALFDGLNRFYARGEDAPLLSRLAAPANVHDDWAPHRYVSRLAELERSVAELEARLAAAETAAVSFRTHAAQLEAHWAEAQRYALDTRDHFERCQAWARVLHAKVRRFEAILGLLPDTLPPSMMGRAVDAGAGGPGGGSLPPVGAP